MVEVVVPFLGRYALLFLPSSLLSGGDESVREEERK